MATLNLKPLTGTEAAPEGTTVPAGSPMVVIRPLDLVRTILPKLSKEELALLGRDVARRLRNKKE
jgi:hypothetical protein